jgi:hypothetical protein
MLQMVATAATQQTNNDNKSLPAKCDADDSMVSVAAETASSASRASRTSDRRRSAGTNGSKRARSREKNAEARNLREAWSLRMADVRAFILDASSV